MRPMQPAPSPPQEQRRRGPGIGLALALEFLTTLPIRRRPAVPQSAGSPEAPDMARALPWFPLVGALLGLALLVLDWALSFVFPLELRAVALLAFDALVTGLLHLDGFVDCCDALLGTRTGERRLAILRDSRIGAYGALGGALLMLARFAALTALVGPSRVLALLVAPIIGRWGMVYAVTRYRYARESGAGAPFRGRGAIHLILASGSLLILLAGVSFAVGSSLRMSMAAAFIATGVLLLAALLVLFAWLAWASRRLGGALTGDTYGAACVLLELTVFVLAPPLANLAMRLAGG